MPRAAIISETQADKRIRQGRVIVACFTVLISLCGYGYMVAKLVAGDYGPALIGLVATLSGCGVGAVAWGGLRLARLAVSMANNLERVRYRLDMLEATVELRDAEADLAAGATRFAEVVDSAPASTSTEHLTATAKDGGSAHASATNADTPAPQGNVEESECRFESAVEAGDLRTCRRVWSRLRKVLDEDRIADLQEQLDRLNERKSRALREEFVSLLRSRDFPAAMRKGEEITELFPDSRMTADYNTIRPQLQRRQRQAKGTQADSPRAQRMGPAN